MKGILAIGDCNTLGIDSLKGSSYPELVGQNLGCSVKNCGFTMSTTREGNRLLKDNLTDNFDWVSIQFGLVDSYLTFKFSPYILYYPDNFLRKQLRSLVKKFKKTCRNKGLNKKIGEINVVPIEEYRDNLIRIIKQCGNRQIILLETIPHHRTERNRAIKKYNQVLDSVSENRKNCHIVKIYDTFTTNMHDYYTDETHANLAGCRHIAKKICQLIEKEENYPVRSPGSIRAPSTH